MPRGPRRRPADSLAVRGPGEVEVDRSRPSLRDRRVETGELVEDGGAMLGQYRLDQRLEHRAQPADDLDRGTPYSRISVTLSVR